MFADEADQDAIDKQYLIYGAIYIPSDQVFSLCRKISHLRKKYAFAAQDTLKFSTGTIPKGISREDHANLKSELLSAAADTGVKAVCYVVQHDVAKNQTKETKLKWAINTLAYNFQKFLSNHTNECGCMFFDRTTDFRQEDYLKEIMQLGLPKNDGTRIPIGKVIAANSTQNGLSHLASLCDIVVGSLRFVFNEPDKDIVGKKLFRQLSKILLGGNWQGWQDMVCPRSRAHLSAKDLHGDRIRSEQTGDY